MTQIDEHREEYILGHEEMDSIHRAFIRLVNKLAEAPVSEFIHLFNELINHTRVHFDCENTWMQTSKFPAFTEHSGEHQRVLNDLQQFQLRVEKGSVGFARAFVKQQLPQWFQLHVIMDNALAAYLKPSNLS
jgi:hemerythrin